MNNNKNTAELILDAAQVLVQEVGFNGFSYAHIAEKVGIRTASIHYHFPRRRIWESVNYQVSPRFHRQRRANRRRDAEQFRQDSQIRRDFQGSGRYVLYLPERHAFFGSGHLIGGGTREAGQFFTANLAWVERVLEQGRSEGHLRFNGTTEVQAHRILASLQGAQLLARTFRDANRFDLIAEGVISALS